jgi:hypothetical protein
MGKGLKPGQGATGSSSGGGGRPEVAAAAFVMPNAPIDPATPLSAFVVPFEPLEAVAGESDTEWVEG